MCVCVCVCVCACVCVREREKIQIQISSIFSSTPLPSEGRKSNPRAAMLGYQVSDPIRRIPVLTRAAFRRGRAPLRHPATPGRVSDESAPSPAPTARRNPSASRGAPHGSARAPKAQPRRAERGERQDARGVGLTVQANAESTSPSSKPPAFPITPSASAPQINLVLISAYRPADCIGCARLPCP